RSSGEFTFRYSLSSSDQTNRYMGLLYPPPNNLSIFPMVPEYKCSLYHFTNLRNFSSEKYFSADWDHLQRVAAYQEVGYPACLAFDASAPANFLLLIDVLILNPTKVGEHQHCYYK